MTGSLEVDGTAVDLTGWTGMLGHNWGSEHAARWIWLRAAGWVRAAGGSTPCSHGCGSGRSWRHGPDSASWRSRTAPVTQPRRTREPAHARGPVPRGTDGADVTLGGHGFVVRTTARVDRDRTVGWRYADPVGDQHEVVNCSVATATVQVGDRSYPARAAVLELGGDRRAVDVPLQPFAD